MCSSIHADDRGDTPPQTHYRTPCTSYASHQFPEHSLLHYCLKRDAGMRTTKSLDWQLNPTPDFFAGTNRRLRDQASFIFTRRKKERGRSWLHKPMKPQNAPQTAQQESGRSTAPTIQTNHLSHLGTDRSHRKRWRPAA
jgi:hypothetical protein